MCGIAGIISFNGKHVEEHRLKQMADAIAHRGPDGSGIWIDEQGAAGLAHRRLAIIDLTERAAQPMHYLNQRYTLVFNGEIYNYIELKEKLKAGGYSFYTESDTEVLLTLYHQKKEKCLSDLDGMFAFALYDKEEQILFCARDRFGEKPFYFHFQNNHQFAFASEMKALWAAGIVKRTSADMLFAFLTQGHIHDPQHPEKTFYQGVSKLKAGHYLTIDSQSALNINKYWDINFKNIDYKISELSASSKLKELLTESVQLRLRSDVPVGSSLSGGIDSSIIVCLIDSLFEKGGITQNTFSARFKDYHRDEGAFMQLVIDQTKVTPHFIYPEEEMFIKNIDKLLYHQEEPFGTASIFAQFCVMQLAKEKGTIVLLDGQGADEIFAGYELFYYYHFLEIARNNIFKLSKEFNAYKLQTTDFKKQLGKLFFLNAYFPGVSQIARKLVSRTDGTLETNFNKDFYGHHISKTIEDQFAGNPGLAEMLYQYTIGGPLENLLRFADRNSMAHSREVRLPFLSHHLVEFAFSLPSSFKIKNGWRKFILRNAFKDLLPEQITWRKDKIGYEPPQNKWMENKMIKDRMINGYQKLVDENILSVKVLEPAFLSNLSKRENKNNAWNYWIASELFY